ncbi:MAG TPA: nitronate monooxygenase [Casimicrobiaceae bacterium]|nr:nitronate monooxygenase [Casimicrobiaceae bacterium]
MIVTRLTQAFGLRHPIVLAPMGGAAGGRLAAAVSNAGGLGLVGGGYGEREWMTRELALAGAGTQAQWGVGLITWSIGPGILELALAHRPGAVMLSFGDPRPHARAIKAAGSALICQVQGVDEARLAHEAGADFIVAQGTEAGGHGGSRATLPLVPAIVDLVAPIPVIAAGGIVDGRGVAAALMLGAQGALMGTRFCASTEALGRESSKQRLVAARGGETARTRVFDIVRDYGWPAPYTGRALRNDFMTRWNGREDALAATLDVERVAYRRAAADDDYATALVWAGEGVDLITSVEPAAALVARIGADAEARLRAGAGLLR